MIVTVSVAFNVSVSTFSKSEKIKMIEEADIGFIDSKIMACPDREPIYSVYLIAEAIEFSHSMVPRHLRD
jgi:hypothetical protein